MGQSAIIVNEEILQKTIQIGIALSATRNLKSLLQMITTEARHLTYSDAASLYIVEKNNLRFVVSQNQTLDGDTSGTITRRIFKESLIPIAHDSIVGYVADTKEIERIDDVYSIPPDKPYAHNSHFDKENNYHTMSTLVVPMLDTDDRVIGVLQLINHLDEKGNIIPFPEAAVPLTKALASQAGVAIRNAQLTDEVKNGQYETIVRLSTAAEFRDNETAKHVQRVGQYSRTIAEFLGFSHDEQEMILTTAPMHDIGKIGIPDAILLKPGRFTPEERVEMEKHAEIGGRIMGGGASLLIETCRQIAISHHEKFDGTGYPYKLAGEDIPMVGRIVAVSDVFDAICSKRVYKDAVPFKDVLPIIKENSGTHFDPACVNAFFRALPLIRDIHEQLRD